MSFLASVANLQEHPTILQRWHSTIPTLTDMGLGDAAAAVVQYARTRRGPLATTMFHVQVMHRTRGELDRPDTQIAFASFAIDKELGPNGMMKVRPSKTSGFLLTSLNLHPVARGRITIGSADPLAKPVIEHELLGAADDVAAVLRGMEEGRRIMAEPAMKELTRGMLHPEADCSTAEEWERYLRTNATYGAHPVGTCRMGAVDDQRRRRRSRPPGARPRRAARRRCLGDADVALGQHQRTDDDDRRAGGGPVAQRSACHGRRFGTMGDTVNGPLDALRSDVVMNAAIDETQLGDFGEMNFVEPLNLTEHPEIASEDVDDPIVIVGLPRTGTTKLLRMIAAVPMMRSAPFWQLLNPAPFPEAPAGEPDPRIAVAEEQVALMAQAFPQVIAAHPMQAKVEMAVAASAGRCIRLSSGRCSSTSSGRTAAGRSRRWVLKTPMHIGALDHVAAAFPRATVVFCHRDLSAVVPSSIRLLEVWRQMVSDAVDPQDLCRRVHAVLP